MTPTIDTTRRSNQVTPSILLPLDCFEQTLEVTRAKPIEVVPLDNLNKHRRPIHQMLREKLQQVTALIKVNQDIQALEHLKVLIQLETRLLESHLHGIVVRLRHLDELHAPRFQVGNIANDIISP